MSVYLIYFGKSGLAGTLNNLFAFLANVLEG